jgi:hypothetical protein
VRSDLVRAFRFNTSSWRTLLSTVPRGWGGGAPGRVEQVLLDCDTYIQTLNDRFTNPSGEGQPAHADLAGAPA